MYLIHGHDSPYLWNWQVACLVSSSLPPTRLHTDFQRLTLNFSSDHSAKSDVQLWKLGEKYLFLPENWHIGCWNETLQWMLKANHPHTYLHTYTHTHYFKLCSLAAKGPFYWHMLESMCPLKLHSQGHMSGVFALILNTDTYILRCLLKVRCYCCSCQDFFVVDNCRQF